jgi:ADP-ribose pyrophosphatase YjhB (NUDIX family)
MKKFNMRATGILIQRKKILLIHRINAGKEYYVFPGGGIEEGESPAEGFLREMKEETNLDIHNYISL